MFRQISCDQNEKKLIQKDMIITLGQLIVNVKKIHPAIKDNIPFTTSMSDPMKFSMNAMRKLAKKDGVQIKNGFRYDDNEVQLERFLRKNGLLKQN